MRFRLSFFILFLCINHAGFAQIDFRPGFVVSLNNDTIPGFVRYQGQAESKNKCIFKPGKTAEIRTYDAKEIRGYGFKDQPYFVSNIAAGYQLPRPVFMQEIITGRISLFYYHEPVGQDDFYVAIKDSLKIGLINVEDTIRGEGSKIKAFRNRYQYRGQLKGLMNDRLALFPKIDIVTYSYNSLLNIVKAYNLSFATSASTSQREHAQKNVARMGIIASTGYTHLFLHPGTYKNNHYGIGNSEFKQNKVLNLGLLFNFKFFGISEKLRLQLEPSFTRYSYTSDIYRESGTYNKTHYTIDLNISAIKLPVSFRYSFESSHWKAIPFLKVGISRQQFLHTKSQMDYMVSEQTSSNSGSYQNDYQFANHQNTVFGSVGSEYKLKKGAILAELIAEGGDGIYVVKYKPFLTFSRTQSLLIQLGYLFN